jgi:hypothetical protein
MYQGFIVPTHQPSSQCATLATPMLSYTPHDHFYTPHLHDPRCNVNESFDSVEEANELRAYAEEIKQRRPAHHYLQPARQYVTALDLDALKNDFLRQATEFSRLPKLSKCHVMIESMKP